MKNHKTLSIIITLSLILSGCTYTANKSAGQNEVVDKNAVTTKSTNYVETSAPVEDVVIGTTSFTVTSAPAEDSESIDFTVTCAADLEDAPVVTERLDYSLPTFSEGESRIVLDVPFISDENMKNGSSISCITMLLNYYGFQVDTNEIMSYMPIMKRPDSNKKWVTPEQALVGDPYSKSYECYSPAVVNAILNYFRGQNVYNLLISNLTNASLSELYSVIRNGSPVIVWATTGLVTPEADASFEVQDGKTFHAISSIQTYLLVGYDIANDTILVYDPLNSKGETIEYSRETFETVYSALGNQAVTLQND